MASKAQTGCGVAFDMGLNSVFSQSGEEADEVSIEMLKHVSCGR